MAFDSNRFSFFNPQDINLAPNNQDNPYPYARDSMASFRGEKRSGFSSTGRLTFAAVLAGTALVSSAYIPGLRELTRKRLSGAISGSSLQQVMRAGSSSLNKVNQNYLRPLTYAANSAAKDISEISPTQWMTQPIEAFRSYGTAFTSSYRDASNYADHMNLPESSVMRNINDFLNTFEGPMKAQHGSAHGPTTAHGTILTQDKKTQLGQILYGGVSQRHINIKSYERNLAIMETLDVSHGQLRGFNKDTVGGFRDAWRSATLMQKPGLIASEILDYAGLDRNDNFRQATLRDHLKFLQTKTKQLEKMDPNNKRIQSQAARMREQASSIQHTFAELDRIESGLGKRMMETEAGRGLFMIEGRYVDTNIGSHLLGALDAVAKINIPGFNRGPLDIFQYPLLRTMAKNYNRLVELPNAKDQEFKNLIINGQFGHEAFGYGTRGGGGDAMRTYTFRGRMYRNTGKNIEVLTKGGKGGGPGFERIGAKNEMSIRLTPMHTSVQRILLGRGIVGGPGEDLALDQSLLNSPHFGRISREALGGAAEGMSEQDIEDLAFGQKILSSLGIGQMVSISSREWSGPSILGAMVRRRNEPWHRFAGRGRAIGMEQLQEQLTLNDVSANFLHRGVMARKNVLTSLRRMAADSSGASKNAYEDLANNFERFLGRLDPNDQGPGSLADILVSDFTGGNRQLSSRSMGVFRYLQEAKNSGSISDALGKKLKDILPGSSAVTDESVLEYIQRAKFHQIIGSTVSEVRSNDPKTTVNFLNNIRSLSGRVVEGDEFQGLAGFRRRRNVKDLFNVTMLRHNPDEASVRANISQDRGIQSTLRRVLPFHRPPSESEIPFSIAGEARKMFMVGNRSMQHAVIPTKDLGKMGLLWLFERPQRIRGGMVGERLPVGQIINPFRRGFFKGIADRITKPNPELMKYAKTQWVGSVLANNLLDAFIVGSAVYGFKPGGLADTLTGGYMYQGISGGLAALGGASSWIKNTVPVVPYMNYGGERGTTDFIPGKLNIGLSSFGDTARYMEGLMPKLMSSPLTQFLAGGSMLFGGFKVGAAMGHPLLGIAGGVAAGLVTGMNLIDDPTTSTSDTYNILRGKKEVPHRANRWWMIGSTPYEGNEPLFYRPHMVAQIGMGERLWSRYGGGGKGKIRHLLYQAPIVGQFAQIANPNWVVGGRPEEMAYMESGVPMTYFPVIGPTVAMGLQILSGGQINRNLSREAQSRIKLLKNHKVKPQNEGEFAIYMGADPYSSGDLRYLLGLQIKTMQNWLGLYGFMSEIAISKIGNMLGVDALKTGHPFLNRPVYESSLEAENITRKFYELNLGDPGFSSITAFAGGRAFGFLENYLLPEQLTPSTEFARRFLIKRPVDNYTINLAPNPQYKEGRYPTDYFMDFRTGSDASRHRYYSDLRGYSAYSRKNYTMPEIAAKMAPFSDWARSIIAQTPNPDMAAELRQQVYQDIRKRIKTEPYRFIDKKPWAPYARQLPQANPDVLRNRDEYSGLLLGILPEWWLGAAWEKQTHDPVINFRFITRKGWNQKTALEEYQEKRIYGHNFAQWERPYETFFKPAFYETLGKNPITSAVHMGFSSSLFFRSHTDKILAALAGGAVGLAGSSSISVSEAMTGDPFIPSYAKDQLYNEMLMDTLAYQRGEASALGFAEGRKSRRLGMPNIERKLYSQMKDLPESEKAVVLELLPERIAHSVQPTQNFEGIKNRALSELANSGAARIEYSRNNQIPTEILNAAFVDRSGFNPYNYNIFPQMTQMGQLVNERYGDRNFEAKDFERKFSLGNKAYETSMNSQKAHVIVNQYSKDQTESWTP